MNTGRRDFVGAAVAAGLAGTVGGIWVATARAEDKKPAANGKTAEEVSPGEDLMREHGLLKRILLIYGEAIRRLNAKEDLPPKAIADSAGIIRAFVEDYHEKLEEDHLFPRFRKAGKLVDLVDVLEAQHKAGRKLTDVTLRLATPQALKSDDDRHTLIVSLQQFIRMYNPHEAREDTILFPAFHEIVTQSEYDALGEDFEKKENQLFGDGGFEKNVAQVEAIEKTLGIYDLAQFTPKV
ncbi:MAG: hemerythrin domain-containing protein [Thermoguttaceae bacterium]|jgi:hemerythrin-like domain-containing protein